MPIGEAFKQLYLTVNEERPLRRVTRFECSEPDVWCAGATLLSFLVALVFFLNELLVFETISLRNAAIPMSIAGKSLWSLCRQTCLGAFIC